MEKTSRRSRLKLYKKILNKIAKLFSGAMIVVLVVMGLFFAYYFVSLKIYEKNPTTKIPKFGLYTIISPSMEPAILVYDVVVDLNLFDSNDIKVGDVITFVSNSNISKGLTVTHRVVEVVDNSDGTKSYVTKGDNNLNSDGAMVNSNEVLGKVLFKIPQLGRVQFLIANKFGWIMAILIPALAVIIYDFIKMFRLLAFNNNFMRFSKYNKKIDTEISVDDLNKINAGMKVVRRIEKER